MNVSEFKQKLIKAARQCRVDDSVPFGFETRVMARIREVQPTTALEQWSHALWRAVGPCLGITLVLFAWAVFLGKPAASEQDLSQALETTVLAEMEQSTITDLSW